MKCFNDTSLGDPWPYSTKSNAYLNNAFSLVYANTFVPNASFLYPLKTSENLPVFWCFQGVVKGCIGNEWVKAGTEMIYVMR